MCIFQQPASDQNRRSVVDSHQNIVVQVYTWRFQLVNHSFTV